MKSNLLTMFISMAILVITILSSRSLLADPTPYTRYYISSAITISGLVIVITLLRLFLMLKRRPSSPPKSSTDSSVQRRENYRLSWERHTSPLFVQAIDENSPAEAFTCPVADLSETGLGLRCSGVYATGQSVHGEIIFTSGRSALVNGRVIREEPDLTSLTLHCTIDPSIFMAEQRELVDSQKNTGPRPAVSQSVLEATQTSLPSHRPKGICRLK